jgi:glycosyltransferase involved in cell wall biosynthesis
MNYINHFKGLNREPRISIITVVFNAGEVMENTILSIRNQTYKNIEYIVVDGASTDGTLELINRYKSFIDKWISEPDKGIYDAMNKGLEMAGGDYVWFINAGDRLYSSTLIEDIFSANPPFCDIYYGETMIIDKEGREIGLRRLKAPEKLSWKNLINGMLVCHQSFLVRKELAPRYDTKMKIAADYAWMLECLKAAGSICNTKLILTGFLDGGMNKKNIPLSLRERFSTMVKHYGLIATISQHFIIGARFFWYLIRYGRF